MALPRMFTAGMPSNGLRVTGSRQMTRLSNICPRRQLSALVQQNALRSIPKSHAFWAATYARNISLFSSPSSVTPLPPPVDSFVADSSDEPVYSSEADAFSAPPPDALVTSDVSEAIIPPLQIGDLADMGLISWTPAGIVRKMIELSVVSAGVPWFWSIVLTTAVLRLLALPMTIQSMKAAAAMVPFKGEMDAAQEMMARARRTQDTALLSQAAMMQQNVAMKAGSNFSRLIGGPVLQVTTGFGLFWGIEKMCRYPVLQMKDSGLSILPDLLSTAPSPGLALVSAALMNVQLTVSKNQTDPKQGHMMNAMRALSLVSIPFMFFMPVAVHIPIMTGILIAILQTYALQRSAVRSWLGIPPPQVYEGRHPTIMESIAYARQRRDGSK